MAALLPLAEEDFKRRRRADQKHIHVPLKAIILAPDWEGQDPPQPRQPQPEDLRAIANADGSQLLLIWEEGGAGKTSLAYEIGSWALRGDVADHPLLPFFLDPGGFDLATSCSLSQHVANGLDKLGGPAVTAEQVEQLLRHKRLLLIVDHFSELTPPQRDWVRSRLPSRALVLLTSRLAACKQSFLQDSWRITEIQPQRLKDQELFDFFEQYLMQRGADRQDGRNASIGPDEQIRTRDLLERLVGHKPVTVLLAWMVIEKAIIHIQQRGSGATDGPVDLLPSSVPEMMQDYVRKSCDNKPSTDRWLSQDPQRKAAVILASLKALSLASHRQNEAFYPQNFDEKLALSALETIRPDGEVLKDQDKHQLLNYLVNDLTLLTRVEQQFSHATYRVALDPLADYLAALAQQECWQNGADGKDHHDLVEQKLNELLGRRHRGQKEADLELEAIDGMRGFLAACRDCYLLWLKRQADVLTSKQQEQWQKRLDEFADLAKIDPKEERKLEIKHLIRRHAFDLEWNNEELRSKAIAELTAYAQEIKGKHQSEPSRCAADGIPEMAIAVPPLELSLVEPSFADADRAAAAEALGHIGGPRAAKALRTMIANTSEPQVAVRRAAAEALGLLDASPDDSQAHWDQLEGFLTDVANHLDGETNQAVIDAKLPLLQGASRGLQRLASSSLASPSHSAPLHVWGTGPGLKVPMLTLTTNGKAVTTRLLANVEVWQVRLPGGVPLEVVAIPDGNYTIGSPPSEAGRDAYTLVPQAERSEAEALREVRLDLTSAWGAPFAMSRFPITQVQWRTLAGAERQKEKDRALNPDPSQHKAADLPVQNVSWYDCQEWIKRLNRWLNDEWQKGSKEVAPLRLALPGESLWEIACRAGSTLPLPFHFGDTLDVAWANYDGNYTYSGGRQGTYIQRPTAVGAYGLVNRWGLADLHGNVAEWCADLWHPSPLGAPDDGRPWMDLFDGLLVEEQRVLLRGGSWFYGPHYCRSASRNGSPPGNLIDRVGFRVCCLPPGLPSWSFDA
ncbi:MAG: SUMF1/EgtB/PvdO family nonheme iron enzyme [Cyanobium sp.]